SDTCIYTHSLHDALPSLRPWNLQGPPMCRGKGISFGFSARLRTSPKAPSPPCCRSRTTARRKKGSFKRGRATRKDPASEAINVRSEEHTSELQSHLNLVC